jgi:hypothetical protein
MEAHEFQNRLEEGAAEGSLASTGEKLFQQFGCATCHHFDTRVADETLSGYLAYTFGTSPPVAGKKVRLQIGQPLARIVLTRQGLAYVRH